VDAAHDLDDLQDRVEAVGGRAAARIAIRRTRSSRVAARTSALAIVSGAEPSSKK
jgi:hypothetical protein